MWMGGTHTKTNATDTERDNCGATPPRTTKKANVVGCGNHPKINAAVTEGETHAARAEAAAGTQPPDDKPLRYGWRDEAAVRHRGTPERARSGRMLLSEASEQSEASRVLRGQGDAA